MNLEQQVVSLDLAKQLKELGVPQESLFYWVKGRMDYGYEGEWDIEESENWFIFDHVVNHTFRDFDFSPYVGSMGETDEEYLAWEKRKNEAIVKMKNDVCSSYTVAELGEMLPRHIDVYSDADPVVSLNLYVSKWTNGWLVEYLSVGGIRFMIHAVEAQNEADARAKMLIWLIENNYLDPKGLNERI